MFDEKEKPLIFLTDRKLTYSNTELFADLYGHHGLGLGEQSLESIKTFIDGLRKELQPSDIRTEYENDLSRLGYYLHEWRNQGVTSVMVVG